MTYLHNIGHVDYSHDKFYMTENVANLNREQSSVNYAFRTAQAKPELHGKATRIRGVYASCKRGTAPLKPRFGPFSAESVGGRL